MDQQNSVRIDVVGSVDGLKGTAGDAERELDRMKKAALEAGEGMRGAALAGQVLEVAGRGVATIALTAAGGIAAWGAAQIAATLSIKDTADEVGKLSQRMGESVESVSELRYAFGMAGAETGEMASLMKSLDNKAQDAARGVGSAAAAYKAMGLSATDSNGKLKDNRQLLEEVSDKLAGYKDSAAKAALVQDALGSGWVKMIPLLNGGAAGFRDAATEARQLGVVMDEKLTKQSAELNDNLYRIRTAAEGARIALGSQLLPAVVSLSEEFVVARRNADGFIDAFLRYAVAKSFNFKTTSESLAAVTAEAAAIEDRMSIGRGKAGDEEKLRRLQQEIGYYSDLNKLKTAASPTESGGTTDAPTPAPKAPRTPRGGGDKVTDYQRLIATLNEKIAVETLDLQTTEKLSTAEKAFASYQADLASGRLKLSAAEKGVAAAYWETYLARAKANEADKAFQTALEQQTEAVLKQRQAMQDKILSSERELELFGLTEAQISAVWQSRLEDAIAIARQNGVSEEQIAYLEEELRLRGQLTEALSAKEGRKYEQDDLNRQGKEMDEFAKSAAKNMQSAMADFLFDPFAEGLDGMAQKFGQTIQRMIADAAAAQLTRLLFGDLLDAKGGGGSGGLGNGWIGQAANWATSFDWGSLISAFGFHEGGAVQPGQQTFNRLVPSSAFANARRYHAGGFAGDEVPAILKKGERVLTPEQQMRAAGAMTLNQTIYADGNTDKAQVRRSAAAGARAALSAVNGAQRYA